MWALSYFRESACLFALKISDQICRGTINSLIPQRDTIKTQRDSGLTSSAFKEHRETLVMLGGFGQVGEKKLFESNRERRDSVENAGGGVIFWEPKQLLKTVAPQGPV